MGRRESPYFSYRVRTMQIPTVKIKKGKEYIVINECDFDAKKHKLYKEPKKKPVKK